MLCTMFAYALSFHMLILSDLPPRSKALILSSSRRIGALEQVAAGQILMYTVAESELNPFKDFHK